MTSPARIVILGAAGRDFHNFNVVYRDDPGATVVAFTAAQIPGISGRRYPPALAGPRYPGGIPIEEESEMEALCGRERVTQVVFAYSDVSHPAVTDRASPLRVRRRWRANAGRPGRSLPRPAVSLSLGRLICSLTAQDRRSDPVVDRAHDHLRALPGQERWWHVAKRLRARAPCGGTTATVKTLMIGAEMLRGAGSGAARGSAVLCVRVNQAAIRT